MNQVILLAGLLLSGSHSLTSGAHQQPDPRITLTVQATPAAKALQELSTASQTVLTTSPQTANDVLVFKFKDVPLSEAMKKIAEAVDGSWKAEGNSYRLIRTSEQVRAERAMELAQDTEKLRKWIAECATSLRKLPAWSAAEAESLANRVEARNKQHAAKRAQQGQTEFDEDEQMANEEPVQRAVMALATSFSPRELAQLLPFSRTVWSSNPTRMQLPLPAEFSQALDLFARFEEQWNEVRTKHHLTNAGGGRQYYSLGAYEVPNDTIEKIVKVLLTVTRDGLSPACTFTLSAYSEKGVCLASGTQMLDEGESDEKDDTEKPSKAVAKESAIALAPDAQALIALMYRDSKKGAMQLSSDLRAAILRPGEVDPLSFIASPVLLQVASLKGENMVACLPDDILDPGCFSEGTTASIARLLDSLAVSKTKSESKDGWFIVKPTRPTEAREYRTDRKVLARFLGRINEVGHLTLDERAQFALQLPDNGIVDFSESLATVLEKSWAEDTEAEFDNPGQGQNDMLRLYGLLTNEQRQHMLQRGLPFNSLSEDELVYVNRLVFGVDPNISMDWGGEDLQDPKMAQQAMALYENELLREPTEALPNGLLPDGVLRLKKNSAFVVKSKVGSDDQEETQELSAQDLAFRKFIQERPELFPRRNSGFEHIDLTNLNYGPRLELNFTFQLTSLFQVNQTLLDTNKAGFKKLSMDNLPEDFKKEFDEAYDNIKKSFANVKPGQLGQIGRKGGPPPPL